MVRWQITNNGLPMQGAATREEAYALRRLYSMYYPKSRIRVQDLTKSIRGGRLSS